MEKRKYCSFPVHVTRAYVDDETGLKHIEAIASDIGIDWYLERFDERAIDDMVMYSRQKKANKPHEGLVDLTETHWETFGIGYASDAEKVLSPKTDLESYRVDLALKKGVWQADELYEDVKSGVVDKQLSVGGYIPDWDEDYEVVEETFENEDGDEIQVRVGVIKRFILEHIAVTPPDGAANPRTEFLSAKSKEAYKEGAVYRSAMNKDYQQSFEPKSNKENEEKRTAGIVKSAVKELKSLVKEIFEETMFEREEQMNKVEKGKKLVEDLRKLMEENPEDFTEEVVKGLGVNFASESEEPVETMTEEKVTSVVKTRLDSLTEEFDGKLEEIRKSISDLPEIPEIPEDKTEIIKGLEEKIDGLEKRLKAIEDEAPDTQDEPEQHGNEDEDDEPNTEDEAPEPDPNDELAAWR